MKNIFTNWFEWINTKENIKVMFSIFLTLIIIVISIGIPLGIIKPWEKREIIYGPKINFSFILYEENESEDPSNPDDNRILINDSSDITTHVYLSDYFNSDTQESKWDREIGLGGITTKIVHIESGEFIEANNDQWIYISSPTNKEECNSVGEELIIPGEEYLYEECNEGIDSFYPTDGLEFTQDNEIYEFTLINL